MLAATAALLLSFKIISIKLLYRLGIDPVSAIALRMLFAAPAFLTVAVWTWGSDPRPTRRDLAVLTGLGLMGFYLSTMLDFYGLTFISAGLERVILFLTPTMVLLLGLLVLKRRVSGKQWLSMALAYAGIVLVFWHEVRIDGGLDTALGSAMVAASAILYAIYLVQTEQLMQRLGMLRVVSLAMSVSCFACLLQYAVLRPFPTLFDQGAQVWWLSLFNGTLGTSVPVFMTMMAVKRIGAGYAAQAGMIGPTATLFIAWWWLSEPISGLQLAGTALVTFGILLLSERKRALPLVRLEN